MSLQFVKIMDFLNGWLKKFIGLSLIVATSLVFIQIIVRFLLPKLNIMVSVPWTEELARYLMIWIIFIGAAVAARKAQLIAVESLVHATPVKLGKTIKYLAHIITMVFFLCIFIIGIEWAKFGLTEKSPTLQIPLIFINLAMSVGSAFIIMNTFALIIDNKVKNKDIRISGNDEVEGL